MIPEIMTIVPLSLNLKFAIRDDTVLHRISNGEKSPELYENSKVQDFLLQILPLRGGCSAVKCDCLNKLSDGGSVYTY